MARLLIIDDDVTLRQALTKHLEHAGHEVRQAADGDAGIKAYERHAADVVIVDIFMPGQGGLQTIGRLRREWPAVKIVAMSGVKSAGAIDVGGHAVALGADRFVTKPFEADTLVALVDTLLRQREGGSAFGFLGIEFGFVMVTVLLSHMGLGELAWARILGGNLIGAAIAFVMLSRRHRLRDEFRQAEEEENE